MRSLRKRPVAIVVRDGWGENPFPQWNHANAVHLAKKPVDDRLRAEFPWTLIATSGEDVGLPAGVMGNSEVGHQNIGAGRIVDQELMRITRLIRSGEFFAIPALRQAMARGKAGANVHLMGLASSAGVHSDLDHLYALLELARREGVPADRVFLHLFADGRDSPPKAGIEFCRRIVAKTKEIGVGRIASVVGRYYAMDRDNRWDRVEQAYRLLAEGQGHRVADGPAAFQRYYDHPTEPGRVGDEFIEATAVAGPDGQPLAPIADGDAVVFFNFRGDRPREITAAFVNDDFPHFARRKLDLLYVTLTEYQKGLPVTVAIPKPGKMPEILGAYAAKEGLRQFRCAETEKFPHVTFFFNDYREEPFPGEERQIVPSPRDVATYDRKPEMSAREVTEETLRRIATDHYDLFIVNFANGDMVGHTGSLPAAILAVEVVDECVGKLVDAILAKGGALVVTADHGNCEQMIDPETGGPHTSHTTYPVPVYVVDPSHRGKALRTGGRLADLAPTALALLGLPKPTAMTGTSLLG